MIPKFSHRPCSRSILAAIPIAVALVGLLVATASAQSPAGDPPAAAEAALQAYSVPADKLAALTEELRAKYPPASGVRIAAEPKTNRLVVLAPPKIQAQIAGIVSGLAAAAPAGVPGGAPTASPEATRLPAVESERPPAAERSETLVAPLKNLRASELTTRLQLIYGSGMAAAERQASGRTVLSIRDRAGQGSRITEQSDAEIRIDAPASKLVAWRRLIEHLDRRTAPLGQDLGLVVVRDSAPDSIRTAVAAIQAQGSADEGDGRSRWGGDLVDKLLKQKVLAQADPPAAEPKKPAPTETKAPGETKPPAPGEAQPPAKADEPAAGDGQRGLMGPVTIEYIEGLDVIVIRGAKRDVDRVVKMIEDIEKQSTTTKPVVLIHPIKHVDSQALYDLVRQLYDQVLAPRSGRVTYVPLAKPNAFLIVGREEGATALVQFLEKLDQPVAPEGEFRVFPLRYMSVADAETTLRNFYDNRGTLGVKVRVTSDFRTNSMMVHAGARDLAEIGELLARIDVDESAARNEVRIFKLKNALAEELAPILQDAINSQLGQRTTAPGGGGQQTPQGGGAAGTPGANAPPRTSAQVRSSMLQLAVIDPEKGKVLKSGILTDVRVSADRAANALVVTGPAESMELLSALIKQLDGLPAAGAVIKVFTIVNGDASALTTMLQQLFGLTATQGGGGGGAFGGGGAAGAGGLPVQTATGQGESALVPLRFGVDQRTNSIIASGSPGDLNVVQALLLRLDESDVRQRKTVVYRLRNAPANDVSTSINQFLNSERQLQQQTPGAYSPFEQIDREVVVVPEQVSNSLIVSATPKYFEEIKKIVEELDARPPMVLIQVLIGEVDLDDTDELGVELGLQDSLLFSRSTLTDVITPGYNFNNQPLGNSSNATSLATKNSVAGQGLSSFALGRSNATLGYGGLVLAASSDAVSALVRALQDRRRMEILARPQVMTLDNQPAFVQVGARVPRITSTQTTTTGTINSTVLENVGLILGVTPRIAPDGQVVMEIDAERSELGPEAEGIPISISNNGQVIRSPQIKTTTAQTTVSARTGQTIVLGGLINKTRSVTNRRVPYLSDVPVLGNLFRYDNENEKRTELLIIMTPIIVRTENDLDEIKRNESARISWCLADVTEIHGDLGLLSRGGGPACQVCTVYPDENPSLAQASLAQRFSQRSASQRPSTARPAMQPLLERGGAFGRSASPAGYTAPEVSLPAPGSQPVGSGFDNPGIAPPVGAAPAGGLPGNVAPLPPADEEAAYRARRNAPWTATAATGDPRRPAPPAGGPIGTGWRTDLPTAASPGSSPGFVLPAQYQDSPPP